MSTVMIVLKHPSELARLRRGVLSAQGLLQAQAFGTGLAGAARAISHIAYVQIDSISVVERAHHHVLHARVPGFKPAMLNQLLLNGDIFEYWSHAAAFLPICDFRFSLPYKQAIKDGQIHWYKSPDKPLMRNLLDRIRRDGPLRSRDLDSELSKRAGWWDWKPAKKALEQLYMQGDLMVSDRTGFQKTYDLTERVLPGHIDTRTPGTEEFAQHLLNQQLRSHACVSLPGITYLRKSAPLRAAVKTLVDAGLAQQTLEQVQTPNGDVFIIEAGGLDRSLPRVSNRMRILSPFDNSLIQRDRLKALFEFDYQLECYLPEAKRQHGYFSLPLMFRDGFVGRMDCKAHRKTRHLEIKALHWERNDHDEELIVQALVEALRRFLPFQGCESVSLTEVYPRRWAKRLRTALAAVS
ncbi:MAG: winged helix DNA-binding domain-containing protein [Congregibacter sp.]|nr:winged helix DNA-binding domain-containing protein [Congregibacter sp.]